MVSSLNCHCIIFFEYKLLFGQIVKILNDFIYIQKEETVTYATFLEREKNIQKYTCHSN